ncbi:MAG TPA: MarR family winged helix-turn-helix transcriptional regulator [Microbacteriaceae bacterium]|nr:MarR family winged helix-turn-helix transcriptional regulator [Microbacteriaceae bacterium]
MTSPAPGADTDASAAVESLEVAFRRVTQLVKRSVTTIATSVHPEMRHAGWVVFTVVHRGGTDGQPVTVGEIIAETGMDKSVVSRQLRALSDWELVTTSRSAADARVIVVEPTELARERFRDVRARQREFYRLVLSDWPAADLRKLEELLNRLADAITDS